MTQKQSYKDRGFITGPECIEPGVVYCLPFEELLLSEAVESLRGQRPDLADEIYQAMHESSETWHDNAPADALFGAMHHLDKSEALLVRALRNLRVIPYPEPVIDFITLGSRVTCSIVEPFDFIVVGNTPLVRPFEFQGADIATIDGPIARCLIGKRAGELGQFEADGNMREVRVLAVDQTSAEQLHY